MRLETPRNCHGVMPTNSSLKKERERHSLPLRVKAKPVAARRCSANGDERNMSTLSLRNRDGSIGRRACRSGKERRRQLWNSWCCGIKLDLHIAIRMYFSAGAEEITQKCSSSHHKARHSRREQFAPGCIESLQPCPHMKRRVRKHGPRHCGLRRGINRTPGSRFARSESVPVDSPVLVEEAKNGCTMGCCLPGSQATADFHPWRDARRQRCSWCEVLEITAETSVSACSRRRTFTAS